MKHHLFQISLKSVNFFLKTPPPGDNSALSWGGGGGGPRGLTPKIKIVDLDILFPYLQNRILNLSIVFELFAFVHFGVRDGQSFPPPGGGGEGAVRSNVGPDLFY